MFGTILMLVIILLGFLQLPFLLLIPASIATTFVGAHFPAGKARVLKERKLYWKTIFVSFPMQAIFAAILFGLGWGLKVLVK